MKSDESARGQAELRLLGARHAAVEDDADVCTALVRFEKVHDGVAADLLLTVGDDPDVDGKRVLLSKQLGRLEKREELALVVRDAARVVPAVALGELERRRLPQVERGGRLDVVVPVDHHGRGIATALRIRRDVADDQLSLSDPD